MNWNFAKAVDHPNLSNKLFIEQFTILYEDAFPKQKIELKQKDFTNPWITKGLNKSSKKQKKKTKTLWQISKKRNCENKICC